MTSIWRPFAFGEAFGNFRETFTRCLRFKAREKGQIAGFVRPTNIIMSPYLFPRFISNVLGKEQIKINVPFNPAVFLQTSSKVSYI